MLFKVVAVASFFATFAAGYVIPAEALSSRSLGVADGGADDLFMRDENDRVVPAGRNQPEHVYTNDHITAAVAAATAEHAKHADMTEDQKKASPLKHFGNYDHADPTTTIPGDHGTRPFPNQKQGGQSKLLEYPLPHTTNSKAVGPARIVMAQKSDGTIKYAGMVSHDQSRGANHPGVSDHFKISRKGS
jgi:hypothetical protein